MKLKIYTVLLYILFATLQSFAKESPVKNSGLLPLNVNPVFLSLPVSRSDKLEFPMELYAYDSLGHNWNPLLLHYPVTKDIEKMVNFSFDPVKFTITSNKDSVSIGEEIELTITAQFLDVHGMTMFQFAGSNEYTLKMLIPKGFIVTGGSYYDYVQGKVNKNKPIATYTIKGFFESVNSSCFKILRGKKDASLNDLFVEKDKFCNILFKEINIVNFKKLPTDNTDLNKNLGKESIANSLYAAISPVTAHISLVQKAYTTSDITINSPCATTHYYEIRNCQIEATSNLTPANFRAEASNAGVILDLSRTYNDVNIFGSFNILPYYLPQYIDTIGFSIIENAEGKFLNISLTSGFTDCCYPNTQQLRKLNVTCKNGSATSNKLTINNLTSLSPPIITATNGNKFPAKINATCQSGNLIWTSQPLGSNNWDLNDPCDGTYTAVCENNSGCRSAEASITIFPDTPVSPSYTYVPKTGILGNYYTVTANCGTNLALWLRGGLAAFFPSNTIDIYENQYYTLSCFYTCSFIPTAIPVVFGSSGCPPITKPVITPVNPTILPESTNVTLYANCPTGSTPEWGGGETTATISGVNGGIYKVRCKIGTCYSDWSDEVTIQNCTPPSSPTLTASIYKVNPGATSTITASGCTGTVKWSNQSVGTSINVGKGTYAATCTNSAGCISSSSIPITITEFGCDYGISIGSNAENIGSVSIGEKLSFWSSFDNSPNYTYQWYKDGSPTPGVGTASWLEYQNAVAGNSGLYKLRVTQYGTTQQCFSREINVNVSPCNINASLNFALQADNTFWIGAQFNKPCEGCTVKWFRNGSQIEQGTNQYIIYPNIASNRGNYSVNVQTPFGCNFSSSTITVDFPAQPNYQSMVQNIYCDNVSGFVADLANPNVLQKARFVVSSLAGNEVWSTEIPTTGNGSGYWNYKMNFPEQYKDGNSYKIGVQHINNSYYYSPPTYNSKIVSCCKLGLNNVQVFNACNDATNTTEMNFRFSARNTSKSLNYRILQKRFLEFGGIDYVVFRDYTSIPISVQEGTPVSVLGLPSGEFKLELKQGDPLLASDCLVSEFFTVDCSPILDGCRAPVISVNPPSGIQEGLNISPTLYANFLNLDGIASSTNTNLVNTATFDGSSVLQTGEMLGYENFTTEAWVFLGTNSTINVGQSGEGKTHRTLFKSKYDPNAVNWDLSVGSNGITLFENRPATGQSRIPLSYNGNLSGWHYISLVYENNLPKLYIDGDMMSAAIKTAKQHFNLSQDFSLKGTGSVGSENETGFKGMVDELKIYNLARTDNQIKSNIPLRTNNSILSHNGIMGYYTFEGATPFKNLKSPTDNNSKAQGNLNTQNISTQQNLNTIYETSNLDWYYNGELVSSQTSKYQIPLKDIKVGDHTYIIKFKGANNQQCETKKIITVSAPPINELSGCYFLSTLNTIQNPSNASEYYLGTLSGLELKPKVQKKTGIMDIWEINHLGDQRYLIKSTANVGKNLSSRDNVSLVDNAIFDDSHVWKFVQEGAVGNMTYTVRPLNQDTKTLGYWSTPPSSIFLDNYSATNEKVFKLEKTACPQPPLECSVDAKVNYERWFSNLANSDITYFNSFNVRDYIDQRPLADFSQTITIPRVYVDNVTNSQGVFQNKPTNWREEKFVSRISGYLCPQQTGSYHIALKTNQWAELYLSTDENPANKTLKLTRTENEDNFKNANTLYSIPMVKGRNIYFEIIAKDFDTYHFVGLGMRFSTSGDFNTNDPPVTLANIASYPRDFKTRKPKSQSEDCGIPQISFIGSKPLMNLWPKDTVFAGDFNVEIEYARGSSGLFSGYGVAYMKNKFLKNTRVVVKFDGISVNDEYELTNGVFESTYDKTKAGIKDVSDEFHKFKSFLEVVDSVVVVAWEKLGDRKKLEYLVKSIKEMAEKDLPDDLQSEAFEIANRLKNATTKADFDQAKTDLAALNNKKEAFLDWYALVIKNSLLKIKADAGTCTAPPGSSGSGTLVANSSWQASDVSTPTTDPAVIARFTTEVNYNVCLLTKSFSDIYLNTAVSKATLKDLAKELNRGSITLLDELYEIYKGASSLPPPSFSGSPAVTKSVEFLKSNIYKLLSQQVYNESK